MIDGKKYSAECPQCFHENDDHWEDCPIRMCTIILDDMYMDRMDCALPRAKALVEALDKRVLISDK